MKSATRSPSPICPLSPDYNPTSPIPNNPALPWGGRDPQKAYTLTGPGLRAFDQPKIPPPVLAFTRSDIRDIIASPDSSDESEEDLEICYDSNPNRALNKERHPPFFRKNIFSRIFITKHLHAAKGKRIQICSKSFKEG